MVRYKKTQFFTFLLLLSSVIAIGQILTPSRQNTEEIWLKKNKTYSNKLQDHKKNLIFSQNEGEFNIIDYWLNEAKRIENINLGLEFGDNETISHVNEENGKEYEFIQQEVYFNSVNWADKSDKTLRIHGYLFYPEKTNYSQGANPGCLCMHGLNGNAMQGLNLGYTYLEEGFITLCFSFPGHGESEGPTPSADNFYYEGNFNETSLLYLTIFSAIQGLNVLRSIPFIDNSSIIVTGGSFGGLHTMYLSGIRGAQILGAISMGALGDIKKTTKDPSKLLFYVFNKTPNQISDTYWKNQNFRIDPKYYLKSPSMPKILFQIGTNDEFFYYRAINGTFDAVTHSNASLQIFPNTHHAITSYEGSTKYFINYLLGENKILPQFSDVQILKKSELFGERFNINVQIDSSSRINAIKVCYRYIDLLGSTWEEIELKIQADGTWSNSLNPTLINSNVDLFVVVYLDANQPTWFTSQLYTAGRLQSYTTIPIFLGIIALIGIPLFLIIRKRYRQEITPLPRSDKKKAKRFFLLEIFLILTIEFVFYLALALPWFVLESGPIELSHIYIFNNIYTWKEYFRVIAPFMTLIYFLISIPNSILSFKRTKLAAAFKTWYPTLILFVFLNYIGNIGPNSSASIYGTGFPGLGLYISYACVIGLIAISFFRNYYQKQMGIKKMNKHNEVEKYTRKIPAD